MRSVPRFARRFARPRFQTRDALMVVLVGGLKGGSGKTTVATNLAVLRAKAGHRVLLVDADRQGTASDFSSLRSENLAGAVGYTVKQLSGREVRSETRRILDRFDDVIVDTNGQDEDSQRAGLLVADVLLVPLAPRAFDLWTLDRVAESVVRTLPANPMLEGCVFLNRADPRGRLNDEAAEVLADLDSLRLLEARLVNRKAFAKAASRGLAVTELQPPDAKADSEMRALCDAVFNTRRTG